jgi:hypothetical protein
MSQRAAVRQLVLDPLGSGEDEVNHYVSPAMAAKRVTQYTRGPEGWRAFARYPVRLPATRQGGD